MKNLTRFATLGTAILLGLLSSLNASAQAIATELSGLGDFISGDPGYADISGYQTVDLGGFIPHHPAAGAYNVDGTLLVTHAGQVYRTSDGGQAGSFADNASVQVKQWSNVEPNVMYYTNPTECNKNALGGASTTLFDLTSAQNYFGIDFEFFFGGAQEGTFVVGDDEAIVVFGIADGTAHTLVWKIGTGWLPDHYSLPWNDFDYYNATPIADPKVTNNLGYIYLKPVPGSGDNNVPWAIISITTTGASSRIDSDLGQCHHATACVWQDTDGSFNPGLVDIFGNVVQPDGKDFAIPTSWDPALHVGWVKGTIYATGESNAGGANALALRKTNQGGYQAVANGTFSGNNSYFSAYAKNGITNLSFKQLTQNNVRMRILGSDTPDPEPELTDYCASKGNSTEDEWIAEVQIGSFSNASGNEGGYGDFLNQTVALEPGESYALNLTPGYTGTEYKEYWKIYADLNQDSLFDEASELLFDAGSAQTGPVSGTLSIPADATPITTRLRVVMKYTDAADNDGLAPTACGPFGYGETEDYTLTVTEPTGAAGTGLRYALYDNKTLSGSPVDTGTDAQVNFNWKSNGKISGLTDNFSVRWTGEVKPRYGETYTFFTRSDDGVRLWVNGEKLIDNWTNHAPTTNQGQISLQAGQSYSIRLEYYENAGGAVCQLRWSSASQIKEVVPQERLYPSTAPTAATTTYTVRARGVQGTEVMALQIGGQTVQRWTVSPTMSNYTYSGSECGSVRVAITNDQGVNHDLRVDKLTVDGTTYQAEAQAVNTGVWQNGSCGGSNSEWLHCSGYIQFELSAANARQGDSLAKNHLTQEIAPALALYPNPSREGVFTVAGLWQDGQIKLYDLQGKEINVALRALGAKTEVQPRSYVPQGLYLVKIRSAQGGVLQRKLVVE